MTIEMRIAGAGEFDGEPVEVIFNRDMHDQEWKKTFVEGGEQEGLKQMGKERILKTGEEPMNVLPRLEQAVIPLEKFTEYALNPERDPDKATAFRRALGYHQDNAEQLIRNIYEHLQDFEAVQKDDKGYGMIKEYDKVRLETGEIARVVEVLEREKMFIAEILRKGGEIEIEHVQYDKIASVFEEIEHPLKKTV